MLIIKFSYAIRKKFVFNKLHDLFGYDKLFILNLITFFVCSFVFCCAVFQQVGALQVPYNFTAVRIHTNSLIRINLLCTLQLPNGVMV